MDYKNTYSGRQHWTIYGCFDETTGEPVAVRFYGTESRKTGNYAYFMAIFAKNLQKRRVKSPKIPLLKK